MKVRHLAAIALMTATVGLSAWAGQERTVKLEGAIGSNAKIRMRLDQRGKKILGKYYYLSSALEINLRGSIQPDGRVQIDELSGAGKKNAEFTGEWPDKENALPDLSWRKKDKRIKVHLKSFAEDKTTLHGLATIPHGAAQLSSNCLAGTLEYESENYCEVRSLEMIGSISNQDLYVANYFFPTYMSWDEENADSADVAGENRMGFSVFSAPKGKKTGFTPILEEDHVRNDGTYITEPALLSTKFGYVLTWGTGSGNAVSEQHFKLWDGKGWSDVNSESWYQSIPPPKGLVPAGHRLEIEKLSGEAHFRKPGEAHDFGDNPYAEVELELVGNKLALKKYTFITPIKNAPNPSRKKPKPASSR